MSIDVDWVDDNIIFNVIVIKWYRCVKCQWSRWLFNETYGFNISFITVVFTVDSAEFKFSIITSYIYLDLDCSSLKLVISWSESSQTLVVKVNGEFTIWESSAFSSCPCEFKLISFKCKVWNVLHNTWVFIGSKFKDSVKAVSGTVNLFIADFELVCRHPSLDIIPRKVIRVVDTVIFFASILGKFSINDEVWVIGEESASKQSVCNQQKMKFHKEESLVVY